MSGFLVETMQLSGGTNGEDPHSSNQRSGMRSRPFVHVHLFQERDCVGVFPNSFSGASIQGHDHFLIVAMNQREQTTLFDGDA